MLKFFSKKIMLNKSWTLRKRWWFEGIRRVNNINSPIFNYERSVKLLAIDVVCFWDASRQRVSYPKRSFKLIWRSVMKASQPLLIQIVVQIRNSSKYRNDSHQIEIVVRKVWHSSGLIVIIGQ